MRFEELVGQEFLFYGQDGYQFKLDDTTWEVVQMQDDAGFPRYKKTVQKSSYFQNHSFRREPIAIVSVLIDNKDYTNGYRLQDAEFDHVWLRFGNDTNDAYQPLFYFESTPMERRPRQATRVQVRDHEFDQYDHLFNPRET